MSLTHGDTVIIVSPAGRVLDENIDNAVATLQSWGLKVLLSPHAKCEYFNFSGTEAQRLSDLQWALDHKEAKVIFAARGGYGAIHLINRLDWTTFRKIPKTFVGYSDITTLHAHINNLGLASLHALMPNSFPPLGQSNLSLESLQQSLFQQDYALEWDSVLPMAGTEVTAEIVGGNLSILYSLQGTPFAPDYTDKILFIEDVGEYLYHIDRMLHSFELGGVFEKIKGLIVGDFTEMKDNDVPFGKSIQQLILDVTDNYDFPVLFGLKVGHASPTMALPLGQKGCLQVVNKHCSFSLL